MGGRAGRGAKGIVPAELDPDRIAAGLQSLDTAGHDRRPDVFHVTVDESPRATP